MLPIRHGRQGALQQSLIIHTLCYFLSGHNGRCCLQLYVWYTVINVRDWLRRWRRPTVLMNVHVLVLYEFVQIVFKKMMNWSPCILGTSQLCIMLSLNSLQGWRWGCMKNHPLLFWRKGTYRIHFVRTSTLDSGIRLINLLDDVDSSLPVRQQHLSSLISLDVNIGNTDTKVGQDLQEYLEMSNAAKHCLVVAQVCSISQGRDGHLSQLSSV